MTSRYEWKNIHRTSRMVRPEKTSRKDVFRENDKSYLYVLDHQFNRRNTLSNLLFIRAKQELRDITTATADPLKKRRNKKVLVITIIPRFPLTIQGH